MTGACAGLARQSFEHGLLAVVALGLLAHGCYGCVEAAHTRIHPA
jgi:hypothetical protein